MKKKGLLVTSLAATMLLSFNSATFAEVENQNSDNSSIIARNQASNYTNITSSFSYTMKRNALEMAYAAQEDRNLGSYPAGVGLKFVQHVKSGSDWDYKRQFGYGYYNFNGRVLAAEDIGNMHYGYVGRAAGFTRSLLSTAAGAYQIYSGTSNFAWADSYYDDPNDQAWISYGMDLWDNRSLAKSFARSTTPNTDALYQEAVRTLTSEEKNRIKEEMKEYSKQVKSQQN
ncbi:polymorphic toxin type 44 domain-containing protein [Bacillus toyonensis]|uniref:polymorphic toxin type 44 domain-containing protein n=1 Tax=Bacillus toyonensis TaxID=155322 RepID=UPI0015CEF99E|nr:polymorphic toxin type 44 domain-containing protein [Bacillus toyonensis]